ncbi:uncharacterized protein LOC126824576 [Patella vulgata]|uniref:uncharacterized protein LOC126824576 n=1 Tax=Patella vulgata TaxID=6465 RepID=UPI00217F4ED6|nr:uncharacterized protein LOC126824576 [Patella vulgata]
MVVKDELIRRRVLFIGTAVPMETSEGLESVQQPLKTRYPVDDDSKIEGIMSYLTVLPSGLQLEYADRSKEVILFPITSLNLCAAVRCVSYIDNDKKEKVSKFVSLSSPASKGSNAKRPAVFTAITRRTQGKKVLECHGFVCESDRDALDLVHATSTADRISKQKVNGSITTHSYHGEVQTNTLKSAVNGHSNGDAIPMRLVSGEIRQNAAPEFYETPPQQGYFYSTKTSPVKKYSVEQVVSDNEGERIRATSPPPLSARSVDRRSAYSFATSRPAPPPTVIHTLPRPRQNVIPVRSMPVPVHVRPRFFSPPPSLLRPKVVSRLKEPYMLVPPPPPPMIIDGPPPHLVKQRNRRRGSESSASHSHSAHDQASSRSSSPDFNFARKVVNGDGGDASSEVSSRPRTPPTDYDKKGPRKPRVSRKEQHEMRHHPNYYPTVIRNGEAYPQQMTSPYDYYPYPSRVPLYYVERSRSVPAPVERSRTLDKKKAKKNRKEKKSKRKGNPSDISTDSIGYMSEVPRGLADKNDPHVPRDFRRFENQFKHERAFSRSLMEEKRHIGPHDSQSTYDLNELMASKGRNGDAEGFALY